MSVSARGVADTLELVTAFVGCFLLATSFFGIFLGPVGLAVFAAVQWVASKTLGRRGQVPGDAWLAWCYQLYGLAALSSGILVRELIWVGIPAMMFAVILTLYRWLGTRYHMLVLACALAVVPAAAATYGAPTLIHRYAEWSWQDMNVLHFLWLGAATLILSATFFRWLTDYLPVRAASRSSGRTNQRPSSPTDGNLTGGETADVAEADVP